MISLCSLCELSVYVINISCSTVTSLTGLKVISLSVLYGFLASYCKGSSLKLALCHRFLTNGAPSQTQVCCLQTLSIAPSFMLFLIDGFGNQALHCWRMTNGDVCLCRTSWCSRCTSKSASTAAAICKVCAYYIVTNTGASTHTACHTNNVILGCKLIH